MRRRRKQLSGARVCTYTYLTVVFVPGVFRRPFSVHLIPSSNLILLVYDALCTRTDPNFKLRITPRDKDYGGESLPCYRNTVPQKRRRPTECISQHANVSGLCGWTFAVFGLFEFNHFSAPEYTGEHHQTMRQRPSVYDQHHAAGASLADRSAMVTHIQQLLLYGVLIIILRNYSTEKVLGLLDLTLLYEMYYTCFI